MLSKPAETSFPTNYDFGKNWETKVKPHLDSKIIKNAIKRGLRRYGGTTHRKRFSVPVDYLSNDSYATRCDSVTDYIVNRLKRDNAIENDIIFYCSSMYDTYEKGDIDDPKLFPDKDTALVPNVMKATKTKKCIITREEHDDEFEAYLAERDRIYKKYFPDSKRKYNLDSYVMFGCCFAWAPTFELTLAKLVEPDEEWSVREGAEHSTVINKNHTKVFDLIYWALDGRLENYLFGEAIKEEDIDPTMGGKLAFEKSK